MKIHFHENIKNNKKLYAPTLGTIRIRKWIPRLYYQVSFTQTAVFPIMHCISEDKQWKELQYSGKNTY